MKAEKSIFKTVVLLVFVVFALIGFLLFSNYKPKGDNNDIRVGEVIIWGTMDSNDFKKILREMADLDKNYSAVKYIEKREENYQAEILEAMASGNAPDLILLNNENLFINLNKIYKIPYSSLSRRAFMDSYVDAFEILINKNGILGIPFMLDPLVMYYNKNIFKSGGIALPPKNWEDFIELTEKINTFDKKGEIDRTAISFGESINVNNLKAILSTLLMQSGNDIVVYDYEKDKYIVDKIKKDNRMPSYNILAFYTEFSNPLSAVYSWNRVMPSSLNYFLSGKLATYFGFASEAQNIRNKNINLNFDIAEIPNLRDNDEKSVYAKAYFFVIPKSGNVNRTGAFYTAIKLSSPEIQEIISQKFLLPSVRKDMKNKNPDNPFMDIYYKERVYAKTFMDPGGKETDEIFQKMITFINGGRYSPETALRSAFKEIKALLKIDK